MSDSRKGVVILGVFVADLAFRAPRQPSMGETLLASGFAMGPGGKGSNQAVAAARAGGDVTFLTRLGADTFGRMAHEIWAWAGVRPRVAMTENTETGAAYIFVQDGTGENAIIIAPGAGARITPDDMRDARATIEGAKIFMTQLETAVETGRAALEIARGAGVTTILNPAPAAELPDDMLGLCDFVIPNESEAEALTGIAVGGPAEAERAAEALRKRGAGTAIVTLGARGVYLCSATQSLHIPAFTQGKVVETTGAGDAFCGAFATALAEGQDPVRAAQFGCAAAAISVSRPGTAPSMPLRKEIDTLMEQTAG
ncbi:MAG: ribokinase [Alphaproteobacteria bacterium]|nr:MAG: ribokinase [Alphaproteobacteria bacterium]